MELSILPAIAENLTIKIIKDILIIEGESETTTKRNGFKTRSAHQWSSEIKIPAHISHESIKIKLNHDKETLTIESEEKEKKSTLIPITMTESETTGCDNMTMYDSTGRFTSNSDSDTDMTKSAESTAAPVAVAPIFSELMVS